MLTSSKLRLSFQSVATEITRRLECGAKYVLAMTPRDLNPALDFNSFRGLRGPALEGHCLKM